MVVSLSSEKSKPTSQMIKRLPHWQQPRCSSKVSNEYVQLSIIETYTILGPVLSSSIFVISLLGIFKQNNSPMGVFNQHTVLTTYFTTTGHWAINFPVTEKV